MPERTGPGKGDARSTREQVFEQLTKGLRLGGRGLKGSAVAGVRALLPVLEAYAMRRAADQQDAEKAGAMGLKRGEEAVLKAVAQKALFELLEITSRTHPAYEGAPVFRRLDEGGVSQPPHLAHLLALAAAATEYFGGREGKEDPKDDGGGDAPAVPPGQTVVFMAVAPGEYAVRTDPITPREMRRTAMRQRSYTPPPAAMLSSPSNARKTVIGPASAAAMPAMAAPGGLAAASKFSPCGCGQADGCARCGGGSRHFSPARYDEDGDCASLFSISCDTRWRVRECFKWAFCDLLRCLGDELCDDGQFAASPDFGQCFESFVCSLVTCLPDAICPPEAKPCGEAPCEPVCAPACAPRLAGPDCHCNYAVGE